MWSGMSSGYPLSLQLTTLQTHQALIPVLDILGGYASKLSHHGLSIADGNSICIYYRFASVDTMICDNETLMFNLISIESMFILVF